MNKGKDNFKSCGSNVHIIDYDSNSLSDSDKEVYAAEFIRTSKEKSYSCSSLLMFLNVIVSLMNCMYH
jgi:hypothetical protein